MVWRTLGRLIWVPIAFLLSSFLAGAVLFTLGLERLTQATHGQFEDGDTLAGLFDLLMQGQVLASGLTIVPALAIVIIGEVARIKSSLFYILGGGLALAAIPFFASYGETGQFAMPAAAVWQVLATAGFAGGWLYWFLAGRRA
ncbi:MAG: hypothetical protein KDJ37_11825 [Hyphomicrobiaceae bacterium]|nr:hypothetical protein [Hyphomicrobiaceae bacterium]